MLQVSTTLPVDKEVNTKWRVAPIREDQLFTIIHLEKGTSVPHIVVPML